MEPFSFQETTLKDAFLITPFKMEDDRGFFLKSYEETIFRKHNIFGKLSEQFFSKSSHGVLRGLHYQKKSPQCKLVTVLQGEIQDVAIDLRPNSPTFGQYQDVILSQDNLLLFYIPEGFAHGFLTLSETALVSYSCIHPFSPETDTGIRWNDEYLHIPWKISHVKNLTISERDSKLPFFREDTLWN